MKDFFLVITLLFVGFIQSFDKAQYSCKEQCIENNQIVVNDGIMRNGEYLKKGPCFMIPSETSITVEYHYYEHYRHMTLLVSKDLDMKKTKNEWIFNICGPYENKNIIYDYFFKNLLRYPHYFKPKKANTKNDVEDIKDFINTYQELILATLQNSYK